MMAVITYFPSLYDTQGQRIEATWSKLFARFDRPSIVRRKEEVAGWSSALYEGDSRAEGHRAISLSALVVEHDDGVSVDDAAEIWGDHYGCIYTTYSHTPAAPRLRIVLPLTRSISPSEHVDCWRWAQQQDPTIDHRARDAKRFWFLPATPPGGVFEHRELTGALLDPDEILRGVEPIAPPPAPARRYVPPAGRGLDAISRARSYVSRIPGAISGQGGHAATFAVARVLVTGFALDAGTALDLLTEWNARCEPPWSPKELAHKIAQAIKTPSAKPVGWLLDRRAA